MNSVYRESSLNGPAAVIPSGMEALIFTCGADVETAHVNA